ncbi:hypothetical protein [uncultured Clostridium sp.]|uniref:hypothetical protein n=1 Tax=uncultured Clostridium sp. TaxID=59620 RepID=UPI0025E089D3|nr:hypothetical protein [uncultured Clostridium sp.]
MLYVYPDNFIVPVIFVENFMSKETYEKEYDADILNKLEKINAEKQENFRDDDRKECYDELQKELTMDWKEEGEYSLCVTINKILSAADGEYACSETGKI